MLEVLLGTSLLVLGRQDGGVGVDLGRLVGVRLLVAVLAVQLPGVHAHSRGVQLTAARETLEAFLKKRNM